MKRRTLTGFRGLPAVMARLVTASAETIWRRSMMIAAGTCTPAEYRRMASEKAAAMQASLAALRRGGSQTAALAPFVKRAQANARRLRRKK